MSYVEAGCPRIVNIKTLAAASLIRRVYDHNGGGGNLHIVVSDLNLDDEDIEWCIARARAGGEMGVRRSGPSELRRPMEDLCHEDSPEQLAAELRCAEALLALTIDERWSAIALYEGTLRLDGTHAPYVADWIAGACRRRRDARLALEIDS